MPRVDFYLLSEQTLHARFLFVCRLAQKAYQKNYSLIIRVENFEHGKNLDELLWTFQDTSFVPHIFLEDPTSQQTDPLYQDVSYVTITASDYASDRDRVMLLNLHPSLSTRLDRFERVIEVIYQEEQCKQLGRKRYQAYQQQSCESNIIDLRNKK